MNEEQNCLAHLPEYSTVISSIKINERLETIPDREENETDDSPKDFKRL